MKLSNARRKQILLAAVLPLVGSLAAPFAKAAPQGARVVAGSASVSSSGNSLLIQQSSNRAVINWNSFSIAQNETVKFALPSAMSAVLNRVTSLSPSALNGTLLSNGNVYLINPNGIIVGPHGLINTQSFVASSLDVDNTAFMGGGDLAFSGPSGASVSNQGTISAAVGNVVLIASQVQNDGTISAPRGSVNLAAGSQVLLQQSSTPHLTVRVSGAGSVSNTGLIQATEAQLAANGGNAMALAINNTGLVRATGVKTAGGHIYLTAGASGEVSNTGTLDVSSKTATGGQIVVTGEHILVGSAAHLNANGSAGGGEVLIGGSWQNADPTVPQAAGVLVQSGAVVEASATKSGNGGTIVVRSDIANPDSITRVYGSLLAQGAGSGNGGRVETSGYSLDATGAIVSTSSPHGSAGQWLLDPFDLAITNSTSQFDTSGNPWVPTASGGTIDAATIDAALASTNVTISTGNNGGDLGNISVNAAIVKSAGSNSVTLELDAANDITITQDISATTGSLNMIFDAHQGTSGAIILGSNLSTNGGFIHFGTGRTSAGALVGGDVYFNGTSAQTINTGGGALAVNGQFLIANPVGLMINTGGGDATFQGTVDSGDTYALVNNAVDWDTALVAAKGSTAGGASVGDTYLATITSSLENTIASNAASFQQSWLGGHRPIVNGTTSQTWYWVTGPEGVENGGKGLAFFTQNFINGSGTPISGAFTNWNGGEPNNDGGVNTTQNAESALQFIGTNALWNDLPESGDPLPYLVETNLAPSALSINAGAGHVTFNSLVGSNKALASLTVTGPTAINGGGITTTGAQTYNSPVTLGSPSTVLNVTAGDLNVGQSITYPGSTAGSLTLQASGSVVVASGVAIAASGAGALDVTVDAGDSGGPGAIVMNHGSSITTNGGNVVMGGGPTPQSTAAVGTSTNVNGVALLGATVTTGAGSITLNGTGTGAGNSGVVLDGSTLSVGSGDVQVIGTAGGAGGLGISGQSGTQITSTGGEIDLVAFDSGGGGGMKFSGGALIGGPSAGYVSLQADTLSLASDTKIQGTRQLLIVPTAPGTSIGLGNSARGTLNLNAAALATIQPGFASIQIGDPINANTSNIDVEGVALATNLNLITNTGGITIGHALNVGSHTLTLNSAGPVTQTAPIVAGSLLLQGTGPFTLDKPSNSVTTIAADVSGGAISFTDDRSLTVGSVDGINGVTDATSAVTLIAAGSHSDLTLAQPVAGAGTGTTVVLVDGRNFTNAAGASAIDPGAGRFLAYSTNPAHDTLDSLTAGQIRGATFAHNPPRSVTATGNEFLYSFQANQVPLLAIQREWNLDMTLAPQFSAFSAGIPVAHVSNPPAAEPVPTVAQAQLLYRGSLAARQRAAANSSSNAGRILDNSLAHVSSFDLDSSAGNSR